jgi:hypothetical protein
MTKSIRIALAVTLLVIPTTPALADPIIAAAGDIACRPATRYFNNGLGAPHKCQMLATSQLLESEGPLAAILPLGDNQYPKGGLDDYLRSYALSWGQTDLFDLTHPVPGNHEYGTPGARGYYAFFGAKAGDPLKGYYSFDVGSWHIVALNSTCKKVGGCDAGSPQALWLAADLAAHPAQCILAYAHHPMFSYQGRPIRKPYRAYAPLLYQARADIFLSGHRHIYGRLRPQNITGQSDPSGIREFIVGTGGKDLDKDHGSFEAVSNAEFGVLFLTLHETGYDWTFVPISSDGVGDSGSGDCSP